MTTVFQRRFKWHWSPKELKPFSLSATVALSKKLSLCAPLASDPGLTWPHMTLNADTPGSPQSQ